MIKTIPKRRMVIDNNYLQHDDLRAYLAESGHNYVVLNEFVAMDSYKGNTLKSIPLSYQILCEHPRQVILLKGSRITQHYLDLVSNPQLRLIDKGQTGEFCEFCRVLATAGDTLHVQRQLLELGQAANSHMDAMIRETIKLAELLPALRESYTAAELALLQSKGPLPDDLARKVVGQIMWVTAERLSVLKVPKPTFDQVIDSFIFREQMCLYIWTIFSMSGATPSNPARIRNDVIDATHAAYATFFDGLLSKDRLPNEIYAIARAWLDTMQAAMRKPILLGDQSL